MAKLRIVTGVWICPTLFFPRDLMVICFLYIKIFFCFSSLIPFIVLRLILVINSRRGNLKSHSIMKS